MSYSNPQIPEGINVSKDHPLKDFFLLSRGIIGLVLLLVVLLSWLAEYLAPYLPFEYEQRLMANYELSVDHSATENPPMQQYLQQLAKQLAQHQGLPDSMQVRVRYVDDPTVNAFATLGGQITLHRGLLERLPDEHSLAMILAHEIAHVKNRDPIIAFARQASVGALLSFVTGFADIQSAGGLISATGQLALLDFSRQQEAQADQDALLSLHGHYGSVAGATDTFAILEAAAGTRYLPSFLSSHPVNQARIDAIENTARARGWPTEEDTPTPLPAFWPRPE